MICIYFAGDLQIRLQKRCYDGYNEYINISACMGNGDHGNFNSILLGFGMARISQCSIPSHGWPCFYDGLVLSQRLCPSRDRHHSFYLAGPAGHLGNLCLNDPAGSPTTSRYTQAKRANKAAKQGTHGSDK